MKPQWKEVHNLKKSPRKLIFSASSSEIPYRIVKKLALTGSKKVAKTSLQQSLVLHLTLTPRTNLGGREQSIASGFRQSKARFFLWIIIPKE
ncbi:MAG: hypothetical protein KKD63_15645 [Proteobacteria bacterium]|nr:hypothetical protein [Pseudomonadota bacterium]